MPAVIESTLYVTPGGAVVPGSTQQNSRNDLRMGYQVVLHSVHLATTYSWALSFASDSPGSVGVGTPFDGTQSSAALLPPEGSTSRDAKFNVDFDGVYLIRLVVDAGLPTEDTQFIRCRVLTLFGALKLVAAGERRDQLGVIPVDATPEGWANDQNANLQRISLLLRRHATSGRVLYVDANRGRNNAAAQNDYTNLVSIPGPVTGRLEETGIKLRAMAHGDFSSINAAITYAGQAAARGEPAPSSTNPYIIVVRPGYYEEDLNLASFVHILGESDGRLRHTVVRTVNAGGVGTHTYNPQATAAAAQCFLANLHLENTANTTNALIDQKGGELLLFNCGVLQWGDDVAQGPAIQCATANPAHAPRLTLHDCTVFSAALSPGRSAILFDAPDSELGVVRTVVSGVAYGILANPTLYTVSTVIVADNSQVTGETAFYGYPSVLQVLNSALLATGDPPTGSALLLSTSGGAKPGNVAAELSHARLHGVIEFDTALAVGTTSLQQSATQQTGVPAGSSGTVLPSAPGDLPDTLDQALRADTLWYVKGYEDPRLGPGGAATIPAANQVNVTDVQRILDTLWMAAFPVTGVPFLSLTSGYNGYSLLDPLTPGVGLGRNINAVGGAVQIQGAVWPTGLESHLKHGGVQVEGVLDIGGFINGGAGDTVASVGGSEIHLNPNQAGQGPYIGLGRATWPNGVTQPDRGFAAASIVAGGAQAPAGTSAYHLHLRTADLLAPNTGKTGNVYIAAGATTGAHASGEVHLIGGSHRTPGGTVGNLWLVPGTTSTPSAGKVWFTGKTTGGNQATLTPANAFVAGTAGTLYFGTPTGVVSFTMTGAEANAAAAAAAINTQVRSLTAADVGGKVVLYSEYGPGGDVLYLGGTAALNVAMGNYGLGAGAVFTPGVYGHKVAVDVPSNGRLRVNGDLEVTGTFIGSGGYVNTAAAAYNVALGSGIDIVGVSLQAGVDTSVVLDPAEPVGRRITITDESGTANAVPGGQKVTISDSGGALFDGATPLDITVPYGSVSLYKTQAGNWKII